MVLFKTRRRRRIFDKKRFGDSPRTGVSSSNSTRTRPLRNWPGKKRSDEFSKRIRNLSNLRPPWGAIEPTSLKRDISWSLLAAPSPCPPRRRNVYKLLDDAVSFVSHTTLFSGDSVTDFCWGVVVDFGCGLRNLSCRSRQQIGGTCWNKNVMTI